MIRRCRNADFAQILEIINDGAEAYRDVIPPDRWHVPYMSAPELRAEMGSGVQFWGFDSGGKLAGVMGLQDSRDVTLVRHAYVRTANQRHGVGAALLAHLLATATCPVLIGTWADASWAIQFYEKHGFRQVSAGQKNALLAQYWSIPKRQIETSVVLADAARWLRHAESSRRSAPGDRAIPAATGPSAASGRRARGRGI